jgi:hypothetical protein
MGYDLIHAVHFADLNGDGRAEYLWVDDKGAVTAYVNLGAPDPTGYYAAKVAWSPPGVIASGVGAQRHEVQFADLNGDGRAEYLWVHPNGSIEAWLNLGLVQDSTGTPPVNWLYQGFINAGIGAPGSSVAFADLNGDGKAEYLSIAENGAVTALLNLGGPDNGPHAAQVAWSAPVVIATGVGGVRNRTVLVPMRGTGRADYLQVTRAGSGNVNMWYNGGAPSGSQNAAIVTWYPQGSVTGGDGSSGANVRFADLNGDGRGEYLEVDPGSSSVQGYLNACPNG